MSTFFLRLSKRFRYTIRTFIADSHFSIKYACFRIGDEFLGRLGFSNISRKASAAKNRWITNYLVRLMSPVITKYKNDTDNGARIADAPIWVCWWTGLDNAPELVKRCVESTYKNAGNHPVHLITKDNYSEYLEIPEYMLHKVNTEKMGLAHLADYIRVKLLATYGGLWLDATIFSSGKIPEICFDLPVFTMKGPVQKCGYISDMRWVTFCLGGWKGNVFYRFLAEAFEKYWSNNDYAVDYLFFDHLILMAYKQIPAIRALLDSVPDNNIHRDDLQAAMNAAVPASEFEAILHPDTTLYKLSWREAYAQTTADGQSTVYDYFLKN